ncbi:MAG TPA: uroporphyrinogen-III C-methyltransferase [Rhodobacteraceae bacterium]|jgi:uroporphyrin-III C-methyltransferase/precorrin-2 dehydrogenase/sirohydrochlorin ferrochelatase|nr:uroporphyrinogen-III C-methyltransferase [Paracoccaceae bacterium]
MTLLPIFLDLTGKTVVVDGGTIVAARRTKQALSAGAEVHVYDSNLCDDFKPLLENKNLKVHTRPINIDDIQGAFIAYGTSNNPQRNQTLHQGAKMAGALASVDGATKYSDFISPSVVDRAPLVIAISSGGTSPIIARILRARLEALLPPAYGRMAEFMGRFRDKVSHTIQGIDKRRRFWENMIDGPVGDSFLSGDAEAAEKQLETALENSDKTPDMGEVFLVGAGPGDPDLLTFRALRLMQRADVVLYDRLVGDGIMELVRRDATRIYVGKRPDHHTMFQGDISALMVKLASEGKRVLRLKGGDPFIFGRGGEEIEKLARHRIPFQVVPGITAAIACSAYAGIPLTHRDHAQSCIFITAHGKDGVLDLDWGVLARPNQTVAVYMGLASLNLLTTGLAAHGISGATPAAIIDNATRPNQRIVTGTIANIRHKAEAENFTGPSIIIIGSVVTLRDQLGWYSDHQDGKFTMSLSAKINIQ